MTVGQLAAVPLLPLDDAVAVSALQARPAVLGGVAVSELHVAARTLGRAAAAEWLGIAIFVIFGDLPRLRRNTTLGAIHFLNRSIVFSNSKAFTIRLLFPQSLLAERGSFRFYFRLEI